MNSRLSFSKFVLGAVCFSGFVCGATLFTSGCIDLLRETAHQQLSTQIDSNNAKNTQLLIKINALANGASSWFSALIGEIPKAVEFKDFPEVLSLVQQNQTRAGEELVQKLRELHLKEKHDKTVQELSKTLDLLKKINDNKKSSLRLIRIFKVLGNERINLNERYQLTQASLASFLGSSLEQRESPELPGYLGEFRTQTITEFKNLVSSIPLETYNEGLLKNLPIINDISKEVTLTQIHENPEVASNRLAHYLESFNKTFKKINKNNENAAAAIGKGEELLSSSATANDELLELVKIKTLEHFKPTPLVFRGKDIGKITASIPNSWLAM